MSELHAQIRENTRLQRLELDGFLRGEKAGKTVDIPMALLYVELKKQFEQFVQGYDNLEDKSVLQRRLADVRNLAGLLFLRFEARITNESLC